MSDTAIKVENLSKRYRIGLKEEMHDTLAGALTDTLTRPIRNLRRLRRLRRLTTFDDNVERSNGTEPTSGRVELNGRVSSLLEACPFGTLRAGSERLNLVELGEGSTANSTRPAPRSRAG